MKTLLSLLMFSSLTGVLAEGTVLLDSNSIYNLESTWVDQNGGKGQLIQFRGQPVVLVMLYTSCRSACPVLIQDVKKLAADLTPKQSEQIRFVVVSLDPSRDTVSVLKKFAETHHLTSKNWSLLRGEASSIRELANVLSVSFKRDSLGNYSHSNLISLLDREGVVRHQQMGLGTDDKESLKFLKSPP